MYPKDVCKALDPIWSIWVTTMCTALTYVWLPGMQLRACILGKQGPWLSKCEHEFRDLDTSSNLINTFGTRSLLEQSSLLQMSKCYKHLNKQMTVCSPWKAWIWLRHHGMDYMECRAHVDFSTFLPQSGGLPLPWRFPSHFEINVLMHMERMPREVYCRAIPPPPHFNCETFRIFLVGNLRELWFFIK